MIKPFGNNILIEPAAKKQVLVSEQGALCEYGKVVAVGDEVQKVQVGETLGFLVWGINKLEVEGVTYYFLPESSDFILGTIEQ